MQNINTEEVKSSEPVAVQNQNEEVPQSEVKIEEKNNEINNNVNVEEGNKPELVTLENQLVSNEENKDGGVATTTVTQEETVVVTTTEEQKNEPEQTQWKKFN